MSQYIQNIEFIENTHYIMEILKQPAIAISNDLLKWQDQLSKKNQLLFKNFQKKILNCDDYYLEKFNQFIKNPLLAEIKQLQNNLIRSEQGYNLITFVILSDFTYKEQKIKNQKVQQKILQLESKCEQFKHEIQTSRIKRKNYRRQFKQKVKLYLESVKNRQNLQKQKNRLETMLKTKEEIIKKKQKDFKNDFGKNKSHSLQNIPNLLLKQKRTSSFFQSIHQNYEKLSKIDLIISQLKQYVRQNIKNKRRKYPQQMRETMKVQSYKLEKIQKIGFIQQDLKASNDFVILSDYQNILKFNQLEAARQKLQQMSSQNILAVIIKQNKIQELIQLIEKQKYPYIKEVQKRKLEKNINSFGKQSQYIKQVPFILNKKRQNKLKL